MAKHILIVDDEAEVRTVVGDMLEELGYRVSMAADGADMRRFLAGGEPIDLILLDSLMPGETGSDLALYAKSLELPVVMISGDPATIQTADNKDVQLLRKPFKFEELRQAVAFAFASGASGRRGG